jgi:hypothetical protein
MIQIPNNWRPPSLLLWIVAIRKHITPSSFKNNNLTLDERKVVLLALEIMDGIRREYAKLGRML